MQPLLASGKCTKEAILLCNELEKTLRAARENTQTASVDQASVKPSNEVQTKETTHQIEEEKKTTNATLSNQMISNKTFSANSDEGKEEKNENKMTKSMTGRNKIDAKKSLKASHKVLAKPFKAVKTDHSKKDLDVADYMKLVKNGKLQKTIEMMSPREALKVPYAKDDK